MHIHIGMHSDGPEYITENFPLIDKFEKCVVERFPGDNGQEEF